MLALCRKDWLANHLHINITRWHRLVPGVHGPCGRPADTAAAHALFLFYSYDVVFCASSSVKKEKRPPSPEEDDDDDVIILSDDSSSPPMNGFSHFKELDTELLMVS